MWVPDSKRNDPKMMRQATKLSAYRAKSVVKSLRKRGVAKTQLTAEGFGGSRPLSEGEDSKRVEIKVVGLRKMMTFWMLQLLKFQQQI